MESYLQRVEKNKCQHKIVYLTKLSLKNESEIKSFTDKEKNDRKKMRLRSLSHWSKVPSLVDGRDGR